MYWNITVIRAGCFVLLLLQQVLPAIWLVVDNHRGLPLDELGVIIGASTLGLLFQASLYVLAPRLLSVLAALLCVLGAVELWLVATLGWPLDVNVLHALTETNAMESAELVASLPLLPLLAHTCVVVSLAVCAWPRTWQAKPEASKAAKRTAVLCVAAISALHVLDYWGASVADAVSAEAPFQADAEGPALALRGAYPTGLPWVLSDFLVARGELAQVAAQVRDYRFNVPPLEPMNHRRIYVFVIGETTRADHLGLNGYTRATTPRLNARGVVSFSRLHSVSTYTRVSVPVLLSRRPPGGGGAGFGEASIVTAFREAGLATAWISLQAPLGFHESPVSMHAQEADIRMFLNLSDYRGSGRHDDAAIPALREVLQQTEGRDLFVVIHLLGSHFQYVDRYPDAFSQFLPDRPRGRSAKLFDEQDKEYLINAYDNTVLFQDAVLDGIIDVLARQPAAESWMMYSSDHGEALFDDCRKYSGHGMASAATQNVAAVFWASPLYASRQPRKVETLRGHADALASTAMMFETLADLGGLGVPAQRPQNSLASVPLRIPHELDGIEERELKACPK